MNYYLTQNRYHQPTGILHFGIGLLGTAIQKIIQKKEFFEKVHFTKYQFDWQKLENTERYLANFFRTNVASLSNLKELHIIWSAGKAGFNATDSQAKNQLRQFKLILNQLLATLETKNIGPIFHLMSSGGGLFEGQTLIEQNSVPNPQRPYGEMKLAEEQFLLKHRLGFRVNIYRLSSVFSVDILDKRKGLMNILMENGLKHKVSNIFGQETTIRDYVLDRDIAKFLIAKIYNEKALGGIFCLASGKPSTIFEIRKQIEKILNKRIFIAFSPVISNSANMSYAYTAIADGFSTENQNTSLKKLYINLTK